MFFVSNKCSSGLALRKSFIFNPAEHFDVVGKQGTVIRNKKKLVFLTS